MSLLGDLIRLSPELRERHEHIPWSDIKGLRNIVVHNYFGTDWREIWSTIKNDLPTLRREVTRILSREFDDAT